MKDKLCWNVFMYDDATNRIVVVDVFHTSVRFREGLYRLKKEYLKKHRGDFGWFDKELRNAAMSAYWLKYEYEIGLTSWPVYVARTIAEVAIQESKNPKHIMVLPECYEKIDVYTQLRINWDAFARYTFENVKLIEEV